MTYCKLRRLTALLSRCDGVGGSIGITRSGFIFRCAAWPYAKINDLPQMSRFHRKIISRVARQPVRVNSAVLQRVPMVGHTGQQTRRRSGLSVPLMVAKKAPTFRRVRESEPRDANSSRRCVWLDTYSIVVLPAWSNPAIDGDGIPAWRFAIPPSIFKPLPQRYQANPCGFPSCHRQ